MHWACCQCSMTRFWLTVIHVAASASHRLSHCTLCRLGPSSPIHSHRPRKDARLQALGCANSVCQPKHINFALSLQRLQQSNPHHVPNHPTQGCPHRELGNSALSTVTQPNHVWLLLFFHPPPSSLPRHSQPRTRCTLGPEMQRERDQPLSAPSYAEKKVLRSRSPNSIVQWGWCYHGSSRHPRPRRRQ